MKSIITQSITLAAALFVSISTARAAAPKDIVDTAVDAGSFKTLAAALQAGDLIEALKGDGPFTVFAPTDAAFEKLPKGTVESLLKPENKKQLQGILTYHVVSGKVTADKVVQLSHAKTLSGKQVDIQVADGKVMINNAQVQTTDIHCSNGVIHVIDAVLLPPKKTTKTTDARKTIEHAIARGSHLYNAGHHQACAALYEKTMTGLMQPEMNLSPLARRSMQSVLHEARAEHCPTSRAWTLRHGLNSAYVMLSRP